MRLLRLAARTVLLLACFCATATSVLAAPVQSPIAVDFDGDGARDFATLDVQDPAVLQVWLSTTGTTSVLRARVPIVHLVATDLDGDHKPELIASSTGPGLQVWTRKHSRFHRFRTAPHRPLAADVAIPHRRNVDDGPTSDRSEDIAPGSAYALALTTVKRARPLTPERRPLTASEVSGRLLAPARHALAPRPPPVRR